jgi:hypothetical protein
VKFFRIFANSRKLFRQCSHVGINAVSTVISDALPFGRLWYAGPNAISNAVRYARFFSRSHDAVIRVYDDAGNVIEAHEHAGEFQRAVDF